MHLTAVMHNIALLATGLGLVDYGVLAVYLATVLAIGAMANRGATNTEEYLLGGRRLRWWLVGISYMVTFLSAVSMVGVPGEAYKNGLTAALWPILGVTLSLLLFFVFIRFYFQVQTFTPFEYLERRFGAATRLAAAAIYCLARGLYMGTVLFAAAKVFQGLSGWPLLPTILLVGVVSIAYTTMGGMRAVVWTDLLQFCALAVGLTAIVIQAVRHTPGGMFDVLRFAQTQNHLFPDFGRAEFYSFSPYARLTLWTIILRALGDHLFYKSADQILIQRMLATSSYRHAFRCTVLGSVLAAIAVWTLYYVGLCLFQFYSQVPVAARPAPDLAMFAFIADYLPSPVSGLVVAALLAAIMSTLDSGLNSLSTVATKDFYLRHARPGASEADQMRFSRRMTVGWGALIVSLAILITSLSESVEGTVLEASGVWMSLLLVLGPIFLLGVTSRRARDTHALAALAIGILLTLFMIAWYYITKSQGQEAGFHMVAVVPFLGAIAVGFALSRFVSRHAGSRLANLTLWTLQTAGARSAMELDSSRDEPIRE